MENLSEKASNDKQENFETSERSLSVLVDEIRRLEMELEELRFEDPLRDDKETRKIEEVLNHLKSELDDRYLSMDTGEF